MSTRIPERLSTLVDLLRWRALHQPERSAYTFLMHEEQKEIHLTYRELDRRARAVAALLQSLGTGGARALLLHPPGLDYIIALFGCLYAKVIAIPAYPIHPTQSNRTYTLPRLRAIAKDAGATLALTTRDILSHMEFLISSQPGPRTEVLASLQWIATDEADGLEDRWEEPSITNETLAYLQYTSGSTRIPKGVMVTHSNVIHNSAAIQERWRFPSDGAMVSWLPLHHDLGLVAGVLTPFCEGFHSTLMSTYSFIKWPPRWLWAISRIKDKPVASCAPDFAYHLCVCTMTAKQRETLELGNWCIALNAAEPVRAGTLKRFAKAFEPCGFRCEAFWPAYGLAEATLVVSGGRKTEPPIIHAVNKAALANNRVVDIGSDGDGACVLVGCGQALVDQTVAIVDPVSLTRCLPDQIGEIWVSGPNVAQGYWNRAEESARTFQAYLVDTGEGPFLRTGDLGCLRDGELFITGRLKDLIIIRGSNHYPQDIELTVEESHEALRPGGVAAFSLDLEGEERLIVVQEVSPRKNLELDAVIEAIRQAVVQEHGLQVYAGVLIEPRTIPKTSSGKVQRHACQKAFLEGHLDVVKEWRVTIPQEPRTENAFSNGTPGNARDASDADKLTTSATSGLVETWLVSKLAELVGVNRGEIDRQRPFASFGLDSAQTVRLIGALEAWLSRPLSPTLAWEFPTVKTLAEHLAGDVNTPAPAYQGKTPRTYDSEPIAIIGLGCRFPGAGNPEAFWRLLHDGVDAITEVAKDRWDVDAFYDRNPGTPGKMNTRWGGFLERVDLFDAQFFGISPREAAGMDPQQRLVLEVSWEALENGGQAAEKLSGSQTGVFIGISTNDYSRRQSGGSAAINAYAGTGSAFSIAANRLSYLLDLRGPSLAVDAACSSSLVTVHYACQSLRNGECCLALAGGVNLMLSPELTVSFSQARMMASDGRCKTFDAEADGYVRGEGCGIVVLKRLSDALLDGDTILAVVRGSAVNQDGRSNGLTAPNGIAQQAVIRQALKNAGISPDQIDYVEAHGTGTPLGDPIEFRALAAALGGGRAPDQPCVIGSVKTNIGHLEAAAGIAGLIKAALVLQNEEIPPHLHLKKINPHVPLKDSPFVIATERRPLPRGAKTRFVGVSSFGFGGTNAHVLLAEAPEPAAASAQDERPLHLLALSARTKPALQELAHRYGAYLETNSLASLGDICFTANTGRCQFAERLAIMAASPADLQDKLAAFAGGEASPGLLAGQVGAHRAKVAFLFTGQGAQYAGMARALYESQPTFRSALERCEELLRPHVELPLLDVLYGVSTARLGQAAYTQPALFALEYALTELWRSWGIEPVAVLGHSLGEYVAACVAEVFGLEEGLRLIAARARLMQALPQDGAMAAVLASESRVQAALASYAGQAWIAAVNGPENVVISGREATVQAVVADLEREGVRSKGLNVSHAFHSPLMEPMLNEFQRVAAQIEYAVPRLAMVSNVTGDIIRDGEMEAQYWCKHVLRPVRFAEGMAALYRAGCEVFIEIGPQPVLLGMGRQCLAEDNLLWLPSLRPQREWPQLLESLAALYVRGVNLDWVGFDRDYARRKVALPTYPFQRGRYWIEAPGPGQRLSSGLPQHPLLGERINAAALTLFQGELDARRPAYLSDHRVYKHVVLPAAAYLEMALAAGAQVLGSERLSLEDVSIYRALRLPEEGSRTVQCTLTDEGAGQLWRIYSSDTGLTEPIWVLHAEGRLLAEKAASEPVELARLQAELLEPLEVSAYYERLRRQGLDYGPEFQVIEALWRGPGQALGKLRMPLGLSVEAFAYELHPVLLDGALQIVVATLGDTQDVYLPVGLEHFGLLGSAGEGLWSEVRLRSAGQETVVADLRLLNDEGRMLALIEGLRLKRAERKALLGEAAWWEWLYELAWRAQTRFSLTADHLPAPGVLAHALEPLVFDSAPEAYAELKQWLDTVAVAYIIRALRQLGFAFEPQARFSTSWLAKRLGIVARYERLLRRLLAKLAEAGVLSAVDSQWKVVTRPEPEPTPHVAIDAVEMVLLRRCGSRLAEVLQGGCDPLSLLFPEGNVETAASLYRDTPEARELNTLAQRTLCEVWARLPADSEIRMLEIGAGTGGTTSYLLPRLPAECTEYIFTDVSAAFISRAQRQFATYSFVDYRVLDIEHAPETQGFTTHHYHVVVAANVLHATADLCQTLRHARSLLAPGGLLVLIEVTTPSAWLDLTFGLTEGWWRFADTELRPDCPLLAAERWRTVLREEGFVEPVALTPPGAEQTLILAQAAQETEVRPWLILADDQGVGGHLAEALAARGDNSILALPGADYERLDECTFRLNPGNPADYRALLEALPRLSGVAQCWALDAATTPSLQASDAAGCASTLYLVQALTALAEPPGLWLVTRGAVACPDPRSPSAYPPVPGLNQAPLWGLGQVIALEHPELGCVRVDLDPQADLEEVTEALLKELNASRHREDQIAWRGRMRHVARLVRKAKPASDQPLRLEISERGTLEGLAMKPMPRRRPGPGEVEIRVQAMGLNFIDLLDTLGLLPFERAGGLGGECAGEIVAVGEGVERLKTGDRVVALAPGSFSAYVTTQAELVAAYSDQLSPVEAATVPIAFLTAYYALHRVAGIQAGERVLIHAAAGATGMAAVQLVQQAGAEVYATASPGKWDALRALGIEHRYSSRSLAFDEAILKDTGGAGANVVLNSLTGEGFIEHSLAVLGQGGRFVELAKRDVWTADQVAIARPDVHYALLDLMEHIQQDPAAVGTLLNELMGCFTSKQLKPLPCQVFPLEQATEAFRCMQQARHVGKVVMVPPGEAGLVGTGGLRADGRYLITGGFGGLGPRVAHWLVERGARHLVLIGRRPPEEVARAQLIELEEMGAEVIVALADVADREQLARVLSGLDARYPLRGVIHAAGVLDDGGLKGQNWERFARVLAPKVLGAWHLHMLTQDSPLDFFVLFSSVAALLGSPGQGNHAAANAFLDAMAHYRRARGLPGQAIDWGAWSEIGAAAKRLGQMRLKGMGCITPEQGLEILEQLLMQGAVHAGVVPIDWSQFGADRPFLGELRPAARPEPRRQSTSFIDKVTAVSPAERRALLISHVQAQVVQVLGYGDREAILPAQGFAQLGMDSLTSVELRNRLQSTLGCKLPSTLAFDYPTVEAVVNHLIKVLEIEIAEAAASPGVTQSPEPENDLEGLTQAETAALLAQELSVIDGKRYD
jgi:acyl transferase domain-containing protein/acyl-CoA synthetase (AMP-forming)/AMP-acid ligase II/NADPH:quinone reductase-like Zn-dependent oxidoreductase/acyl carrier protein/NADP-dependent 3-hydroxy acid dehydrogenase YdfG